MKKKMIVKALDHSLEFPLRRDRSAIALTKGNEIVPG